jgi:tetratricopeptide (TPR) repeat protein
MVLGISSDKWGQRAGFFKTASALDPDDFGAQYNLGITLLRADEGCKDAIQVLNKALELEKKVDLDDYLFIDSTCFPVSSLSTLPTAESLQVPIKLALAYAYRDSKQYKLAVQAYKKVLVMEPDNPVAPWGLCFTYRGWRKNFKHQDALHWEKRAKGMDCMPAVFTEGYMPKIVYKYFGMLH